MMAPASTELLLQAWEAGGSCSAAMRALLMLSVASPHASPETLAALSIGQRNADLLSLRARLFGGTMECLTRCPSCSDSIELTFDVDDVRSDHAAAGAVFREAIGEHDVTFRIPTSADLFAVEHGFNWTTAEQRLLERCVVTATAPGSGSAVHDLPASVANAIAVRMSEIDPQASIELDVACPSCGTPSRPPFDVAAFLWAEVDIWARQLLQDVHTIASAYSWSESSILAMTPARRQAYLEQIGA